MHAERTEPYRAPGQTMRALRVEVVSGPDAGLARLAESESLTVGTAEGNDLVLSDDTVSRYHLELSRSGDRVLIVDHRSTNGTLVGAAQIDRATVTPGTVISIGRTSLRVTDGHPIDLELHDSDRLEGVRGRSAAMRALMAKATRAAASNASVLLLGETGSGKEVIARAIHQASPRADKPFETVDCGALMPALVASELFGHERGAFTGADRQHIGAFERAHGGTLFLDEIGELPATVQAALLGALERRSFRRLGGQAAISVDVRLISATHRDLRSAVNAGTFRQDLYYRIGVLLLRVPPLRERLDDIPLLVEHFLEQAGLQLRANEVFPTSAIDALAEHHWPGNVRELRNFVEAALAMGEPPEIEADEPSAPSGKTLDRPEDLFHEHARDLLIREEYGVARSAVVRNFELLYLTKLLERCRGNVSKAAREANMDRSHLNDMLMRLGLS
jgi:DNA-binding NtrC family response regulator